MIVTMRSLLVFLFSVSLASALDCDLTGYKAISGLKAAVAGETLRVEWEGLKGQEARAVFALANGQPVIQELAIRKAGGPWSVLGTSLKPEFETTTGRRRISGQQVTALQKLGVKLTPEVVENERWNAFWDAPLQVPGEEGTAAGLPRKPEEIRHATASYKVTGCKVRTDGLRLEIEFPGVEMGVFSGRLQYTVYKGINLLRQEVIAKNEEPQGVAYKYRAGLTGFSTDGRMVWRDTARAWQQYRFGGAVNQDPVALRARNRLAVYEAGKGSLVVFPSPHKFFFGREIELNLGYVWYRKDSATSASIGIRHGDHEEMYRPFGYTDEVWKRRVAQSRHFTNNFALYNAPRGTWQRMPVYFYLSPDDGQAAQETVLAFTHQDTYKAMPGYKVLVNHFHTHFNEQLTDAGTLDYQPTWLPVFRALGVDIAIMSDFHADSHPKDPGPIRLKEQNVYFEGCKRFSDRGFLLMPGEEDSAYYGGHYTTVFPHPVYWTMKHAPGQPLVEKTALGKVWHIGSSEEQLQMVKEEGALSWTGHPRMKSSTGYPDAMKESAAFNSDRFMGGAFQNIPVDLSQSRLCEKRCFDVLDDMNNWTGPKYLIAEGDTYMKYPDDESYPQMFVNYVKLDKVPAYDEDWSPILKSMRAGDYFITSGEVLIHDCKLEGSGAKAAISAELEWTFPLDFVEVVWGDGKTVDRKIVPAKNLVPFGTHRFQIPVNLEGKKWVRFAAWDSAGNGAFTQPVHLK